MGRLIRIWLAAVSQDTKYATRVLLRTPNFASAAILSLALGIGANTALFQMLNALLLRGLPVENPETLVRIDHLGSPDLSGSFWQSPNDFTYPQWQQLQRHKDLFSGMFAWGNTQFNITPNGQVREVEGIYVSGGFFRVLGVAAQIGRVISDTDDRAGCPAVAVISDAFWHREFGDKPLPIGKQLVLNGHVTDIIGVAPQSFTGLDVGKRFEVAVPLCTEPTLNGVNAIEGMDIWWLSIVGRLKPGIVIGRANAYLDSIWPDVLKSTIPYNWTSDIVKEYLRLRIHAAPNYTGFSALRGDAKAPLVLLLAIACLILLMACVNLANLVLARAMVRKSEIGVRLAIGASRSRVVCQLVAESLLLALVASLAAIALAQIFNRYLLSSFATSNEPLFLNLSLDWHTLAFIAIWAAIACLLFGLIPAIRATDHDLASLIQVSRRNATASRKQFRMQHGLVIFQTSFSLVLLVGAFLFVRSFGNLITLNPGFREQGLLVASVFFNNKTLPEAQYTRLFRQMLDELRRDPAIQSAATVAYPPITGSRAWQSITIDEANRKASNVPCNFNTVSEGYFRTMGTPLIAGRDFNSYDRSTSQRVALVDETFVSRFLPGQYPVGKTFYIAGGPEGKPVTYQIVGLVKSARYVDLKDPLSPTAFFVEGQGMAPPTFTNFVVRSKLTLEPTISIVRDAILRIDRDSAIDFRPMSSLIHDSTRRESILAQISALFGFLAIVLAMIGLYGVTSYSVALRRREIGLRLAMGARPHQILRLILRQSSVLLASGMVVGTGFALAGAQAVRSMLFDVAPDDPLILIWAILILTMVLLLATVIPAHRAASLDPMSTLREE